MGDDRVVSLMGGLVVSAGVPNDGLVAALERWAEQARSGELQAISMVGLHPDGSTSIQTRGAINRAMIGAMTICVADAVDHVRWRDADEDDV